MKRLFYTVLGALPFVACNSCAPQPAPAPPPIPTVDIDAGPAPAPAPTVDAGPPPAPSTPVQAACANLRALGCSAGMNGCEAVLQHVVDSNITTYNLGCLTLAKSKEAARSCKPAVACP